MCVMLVALAEWKNSAPLRRREEERRLPRLVPGPHPPLHRNTSGLIVARFLRGGATRSRRGERAVD